MTDHTLVDYLKFGPL